MFSASVGGLVEAGFCKVDPIRSAKSWINPSFLSWSSGMKLDSVIALKTCGRFRNFSATDAA